MSTVPQVNAGDLLASILVQARAALDALHDEREGDFTRAVYSIEGSAADLGNLVRSW